MLNNPSTTLRPLRDGVVPAFTDAVVIGGGIVGLCTAYHLVRYGVRRIVLLEQFRIGHDRGSSHGAARITRSTYHNVANVRLMRAVNDKHWPELERILGGPLILWSPGVFYGPEEGPLSRYYEAVTTAGARVWPMRPDDARQRFPQFHFPDRPLILCDETAGVIRARDVVVGLHDWLERKGVEIWEETAVLDVDSSVSPVRVTTNKGEMVADKLIVTAGAWTSRLIPSLSERLSVARQTVGYLELDGVSGVGSFPPWVHVGGEENDVWYGLPEVDAAGIKAARHITQDRNDDPDEHPGPDPLAKDDLYAFARRHFVKPVLSSLRWETCLYTNTASEDFVLDLIAPNVAVGAGMSGHGFKLAPISGDILAQLALKGQTDIPAFEEHQAVFAAF